MGLDTTHDCWHGSYGSFSWWRERVAEAAGYKIRRFSDQAGYVWDNADIPWEIFKEENYRGEWANGPIVEDPLLYLIVHSDCDGVIHPEEGRHLAARLEQLLPVLPARAWSRYTVKGATEQFIAGLLAAHAAGEDVEFY